MHANVTFQNFGRSLVLRASPHALLEASAFKEGPARQGQPYWRPWFQGLMRSGVSAWCIPVLDSGIHRVGDAKHNEQATKPFPHDVWGISQEWLQSMMQAPIKNVEGSYESTMGPSTQGVANTIFSTIEMLRGRGTNAEQIEELNRSYVEILEGMNELPRKLIAKHHEQPQNAGLAWAFADVQHRLWWGIAEDFHLQLILDTSSHHGKCTLNPDWFGRYIHGAIVMDVLDDVSQEEHCLWKGAFQRFSLTPHIHHESTLKKMLAKVEDEPLRHLMVECSHAMSENDSEVEATRDWLAALLDSDAEIIVLDVALLKHHLNRSQDPWEELGELIRASGRDRLFSDHQGAR